VEAKDILLYRSRVKKLVYEPFPIIFSAKVSTEINNVLENIALIKRKTKSDIIRLGIEMFLKEPLLNMEDPYHQSPYKKVLTFKTTKDLASRIDAFCIDNGISISKLVRFSILLYLQKNGMADVYKVEKVHFL